MDLLKQEIAKKRNNVQETSNAPKKSKYLTNAQKLALAKGQDISSPNASSTNGSKDSINVAVVEKEKEPVVLDVATIAENNAIAAAAAAAAESKEEDEAHMNISKEDAFRRLRMRRQPVTLFGETDKQRLRRLRQVELLAAASALDDTEGQRNFLIEQEKAEKEYEEDTVGDAAAKKKEEKVWNEDDAKSKEDFVRFWIKRMLSEWDKELEPKIADMKKSASGRQEINKMKQAREYLKPLLKGLKQRDIKPDILSRLDEIVRNCKSREYNKAIDAYIVIAIGNAPWPMGVTCVGIHERSAREKIHSSGVAHVLNDETTRKYIQSVKRLMTFCQAKYPPYDLALAVI